MPPAPAIRYAYATPDCALGTDEVVIASADCVGLTATDALDFFVVSAALVAVTVTLVLLLTVGAVNIPALEMLPAVADQVTVVLLVPCTVAANCCVLPEASVELVGETVTLTAVEAVTDTVVLAFLVVSAALVAVTVAVVLLVTVGAVNNPLLEMEPALADHVTVVFVVPCTVAANCWVLPEPTVALVGEIATLILVVAAATIVICACTLAVAPWESVTLTQKYFVIATAGFPVTAPVVPFRYKPPGRAPSITRNA